MSPAERTLIEIIWQGVACYLKGPGKMEGRWRKEGEEYWDQPPLLIACGVNLMQMA